MDAAFTWAQHNKGLCTEEDYPYTSGTTQKAGRCEEKRCVADQNVAPTGYVDVESNSKSNPLVMIESIPL